MQRPPRRILPIYTIADSYTSPCRCVRGRSEVIETTLIRWAHLLCVQYSPGLISPAMSIVLLEVMSIVLLEVVNRDGAVYTIRWLHCNGWWQSIGLQFCSDIPVVSSQIWLLFESVSMATLTPSFNSYLSDSRRSYFASDIWCYLSEILIYIFCLSFSLFWKAMTWLRNKSMV